jgi:hypothetical protein
VASDHPRARAGALAKVHLGGGAQHLTSYSNFWKQFYRKFPQYREAAVTAREFEPGERVEVDYAGDTIDWIELQSGEIRKAYVFVAGLGFSQLLFAWATEDMKSRNWLGAHRRMFAFYGGVTHVTVPDCLKQGVLKCHLYDPDLNPGYAQLTSQYATAVVPARPNHPKDKAIVEGLVKILMRHMRFRHRHFASLAPINRALLECVERINTRRHSRFGVSRRERFEALEKSALKALPVNDFDGGEWSEATLHADCYVLVEAVHYSAPHIHRHKKLRIKLTENQVEIFLNLERLAMHPRCRHRDGRRIRIEAHFPPASQAYYEATLQKLLSQSRFIHPELHRLFVELFTTDVYGHLRRCECAAAPKRLIRPDMKSRAGVSPRRSPPCVFTTNIACRTSRRCLPKRANKQCEPIAGARSNAGPATPCCATPAAAIGSSTMRLLLCPPQPRRTYNHECRRSQKSHGRDETAWHACCV